jgi:hypothetical protein
MGGVWGGSGEGCVRKREREREMQTSTSHFTLPPFSPPPSHQGLPWVQATGEAEATCAALNSSGLVDGCQSRDVDTLLFGAEVVYKTLHLQVGGIPPTLNPQPLGPPFTTQPSILGWGRRAGCSNLMPPGR